MFFSRRLLIRSLMIFAVCFSTLFAVMPVSAFTENEGQEELFAMVTEIGSDSDVVTVSSTPTTTRISPTVVTDPLPTPKVNSYWWLYLLVIVTAVVGMGYATKKQKE